MSKFGRLLLTLGLAAFLLPGVGLAQLPVPQGSTPEQTAPLENIPFPNLDTLEPAVSNQLMETRLLMQAALNNTGLSTQERGQSLGSGCRLFHAYEIMDTAAACYRNASRLAPEDPRWHHALGALELKEGRLPEAIEAFNKELALAPKNPTALILRAEALSGLNRTEEASGSYSAALDLDPTSAAAMAGLGQIALAEKRFNEAIILFETALLAAPQANKLYYPLALAYRGVGEEDKARENLKLRGPIGVTPQDPLIDELPALTTGELAHLLRGRLAFKAGQPEVAVREFRSAVEAAPESGRARVNLGSALAQVGQAAAAAEQFREALRFDPNNATAHYNLGVIQAGAGNLQEAAQHLTATVRLAPEDADAHRQLAEVLSRGGLHQQSLEVFKRAVQLAPASEGARVGLASAHVALEQYDEAIATLREARESLPDSGRVMHALARLLAGSPDAELRKGSEALELALLVFGARRSPGHAATVAMALAELDRCDEAAEWQSKALAAIQGEGEEVARMRAPLAAALKVYQGGTPCRSPAAEGGEP